MMTDEQVAARIKLIPYFRGRSYITVVEADKNGFLLSNASYWSEEEAAEIREAFNVTTMIHDDSGCKTCGYGSMISAFYKKDK